MKTKYNLTMRIFILFVLLSAAGSALAQTQSDLATGRSLLFAKKYKEAVPHFEKIMSGTDESLKRATVNFITETWVDQPNDVHIALSGEIKSYGKILIDYMNATFNGKEANMTAADHYTAGLIFWSLGSSGALENIPKALRQFQIAYGGGHKQAVGYFASALAAYKKSDPSVPWSAILEAHVTAVSELKSMKPLTDLGWNNYKNFTGWLAAKSPAERDTARDVFLSTLNIVAAQFPDSLYKVVDYYHRQSFLPDHQDTALVNLVDNFLAAAANAPQTRKSIAWTYLYKFFYDLTPKTVEIRNELMKKIKALYANDDKQVMDLIVAFINETDVNAIGYAMSLNSKWLGYFPPMKMGNARKFYYAAAVSDADFTSFIPVNEPVTDYLTSIVNGYEDKIRIFNEIITTGALNINAKAALGQVGTSINMAILQKLMALPALSNNSRLKYVYADMAVLNNYAVAINKAQVPVQIDELANVFSRWTAAEKKGYDVKILTKLVVILQKIRDEVPTSELDLDRLQKAMMKLKMELAL
jgi:hypothetical protein